MFLLYVASVLIVSFPSPALSHSSVSLIVSFPSPALSHSCLVTVWCRTPVSPPIYCVSLSLVCCSIVVFSSVFLAPSVFLTCLFWPCPDRLPSPPILCLPLFGLCCLLEPFASVNRVFCDSHCVRSCFSAPEPHTVTNPGQNKWNNQDRGDTGETEVNLLIALHNYSLKHSWIMLYIDNQKHYQAFYNDMENGHYFIFGCVNSETHGASVAIWFVVLFDF